MVMKRNVTAKNLRRSIMKSLGRYIAIVAIIALGAGMFVGLLSTKSDMIATAQKYMDEQNMFDLRLLSTYGWSDKELEEIKKLPQVQDAEGMIELDVIVHRDGDTEELVYRLHSLPQTINQVHLLGGRMPETPDECLVDGFYADDSVLGTQIVISDVNDQDTIDSLAGGTLTVVGYVSTPIYMDMSRGNTTIGNGTLTSYVYVMPEAFNVDYYTEIAVTIPGDYAVYSDAFTDAMEELADKLEPDLILMAKDRYLELKNKAEQEYADGMAEYEQGKKDYEEGKAKAEKELLDAKEELLKGQKELNDNWAVLIDGEAQIQDAQDLLNRTSQQLTQSATDLADAKAEAYEQLASAYDELMTNYKTVTTSLAQVQSGLAQIDSGIPQLEDGLSQLESGIQQIDLMIGVLRTSVGLTQSLLDVEKNSPFADAQRIAQLENQLATQQQKLDDYSTQRQDLIDTQATYTQQLADLKQQKTQLEQTKKDLQDAQAQIELGMLELESSQLQTENTFAAAQAKLDAAVLQLEAGQADLDVKKQELQSARAELEDARKKISDAWVEYHKGLNQSYIELNNALKDLQDAKKQLDDGKKTIDTMEEPDVFLLNRNTNAGYLAVDNNSDIVAGVSRVFPAFFLLVAALVCITTMTRMVDEERTQIGTLKALGYSNQSIVNKYLIYSGSAAVLGCGIGVVAGSIVFPKILWAAYGIILCLTPHIELQLNWPLCIAVVLAYSVVSMLVTWYCCRRELREVPAELIRPKSPAAGKKILLEYLPFWKKISFLNKVMFRNVFRYRQRFLMMLVGIGGCTALLLSGFGLRDSIVDIVDYQFAEVSTYDMEVYFAEGQNQQAQESFCDTLRSDAEDILFYHRTSMEMDFDGKTKSIDLLAAGDDLRNYYHLHQGKNDLGMPGLGEMFITIGAADAMGLKTGDTVVLRNSDMQNLQLTITGIFDNNVNNYGIILPQTMQDQWGELPEMQMALINVRENRDIHEVGATIAGMDHVMNIAISEDIANQVGSMLDALDLVVITVVICAALLAIIVLYNLTNISITERVREIATIKVLGFYEKETAAYVFKENLFLSALGAAVGLVGGIFLLQFIMSQIKIDMVWLDARLKPLSYLWAVLLTMVSASIVDFLLYFKLQKINMAEALKSIE